MQSEILYCTVYCARGRVQSSVLLGGATDERYSTSNLRSVLRNKCSRTSRPDDWTSWTVKLRGRGFDPHEYSTSTVLYCTVLYETRTTSTYSVTYCIRGLPPISHVCTLTRTRPIVRGTRPSLARNKIHRALPRLTSHVTLQS